MTTQKNDKCQEAEEKKMSDNELAEMREYIVVSIADAVEINNLVKGHWRGVLLLFSPNDTVEAMIEQYEKAKKERES